GSGASGAGRGRSRARALQRPFVRVGASGDRALRLRPPLASGKAAGAAPGLGRELPAVADGTGAAARPLPAPARRALRRAARLPGRGRGARLASRARGEGPRRGRRAPRPRGWARPRRAGAGLERAARERALSAQSVIALTRV